MGVGELIKRNRTVISAFCVGVSQWLLLTVSGLDKLFFVGTPEISQALVWGTKIFSLFMLGSFWGFMAYAVLKVRAHDSVWMRGTAIFFIYLAFQSVILLILWPGTWAWDDIAGFIHAETYHLEPWQHLITSVLYICCAHIFPYPGGYVLIANLMIALCVAGSITLAEEKLNLRRIKNPGIDIVLKLIPFAMPPIILYQFGGYRIGLLMYLELLTLVLIAVFLKSKHCSKGLLFFFALLLAVVAEWRSENIICLPLGIIAIMLLRGNALRERIAALALCVIVFGGIHRAQKQLMGGGYQYSIMSTMLPAVELMKHADPIEDQEEIRKMSSIISPELVYDNPDADGNLIWSLGKIHEIEIDKEMYDRYMDGLIRLALKHPAIILNERMKMFLGAAGLYGPDIQVSVVRYTVHLADEEYPNEWFVALRERNWSGSTPVFPDLRKHFIYYLGQQNSNGLATPLFYVYWNALIPIAILIMGAIVAMVKRNGVLLAIIGFLLLKTCAIILAEPGTLFMYYLPQYMAGYMLLSWGIVMIIGRKEKSKGA